MTAPNSGGRMAQSNRKAGGERLRLIAERLDLLFAYVSDAYYLSDRNGTFVGVNRAAEELSGYNKGELIGKNFTELGLVPQGQALEATELLARNRRGGRTGPDELTFTRKDGTQVSLEITTYPLTIVNEPLVLRLARGVTKRGDTEEQLRAAKNRLDFLLSTSPAVIYSARTTGDYGATFISENVLAQMGYEAREFTEDPAFWLDHIHHDDRPRVLAGLASLLEHGRHIHEYRFLHKDGTYRWMADELRLVRAADGEPFEMIGYRIDVTGRKLAEEELRKARNELESRVKERTADLAAANEQLRNEIAEREKAQRALRQSEEKFRSIIHSAPAAVVVVESDGCISLVNDQAEALFGYAEVEMIGQPIEFLVPTTRRSAHIRERAKFAAAPSRRIMSSDLNIGVRHKDGHVIPVEISLSPLESRAGPIVVTTVRDISLRKEAEETIRHMAYHDALTGLPNRELLKDRLDIARAQARRSGNIVAVICLDLDRFKNINDSLGHTAGDVLLQRVGRQLSNLVRDGDTVARMSGDEFVILLPELAEVGQAIDVGERVLKRIGRRRTLQGQEILVTASLGISLFPSDGDNAEDQLVHADTAMYRAKDAGRNRYEMYHSDMTANIEKRLVMEAELRHALEDGAIVPYFQPQVDVKTGRLIGAEALARWHHPQRGIVLPDDFIQVAKEAGLSLLLTEQMLRSASALHVEMRDKGLPLMRMAVNLGPTELHTSDLPKIVARILAQSGMAPEHLQLEITEQEAMQDPDLAVEILTALRSTGVQIIVDDFGIGHSSLSYLRRFPVNGVKVDRSFIRDVEDDQEDAAIVSAIISMAKSLNLTVVAEGVETEGQLEFLREQECDEYQGFLFSPAVPADEFEKLLKASATGAKQARIAGRRPNPA